jgi:hypothetical protein
MAALEDARHLDTADTGQIDIQKNDIGGEIIGFLECFVPVGRFAQHNDILLVFETPQDSSAEKRMIVHDHDLDTLHWMHTLVLQIKQAHSGSK